MAIYDPHRFTIILRYKGIGHFARVLIFPEVLSVLLAFLLRYNKGDFVDNIILVILPTSYGLLNSR